MPAQHLPQDEGRALHRRQALNRDDQRKPNGLTGEDRLLGALVGDRVIGGKRGRPSPALPPVEHVEADVRLDTAYPRAKRRTPLEALPAAPGADEGLLDGVLSLARSEHPPAEPGQLEPVELEASVVDHRVRSPCRIAVCPVRKIDQATTAMTNATAQITAMVTAAAGQLRAATVNWLPFR